MSKRIVVGVIMLAVVVGGAVLVRRKQQAIKSLAPVSAVAIPVSTAAVREGTIADVIRTVALVQAQASTIVAAQVAGSLIEVRLREGDRVQRGDLLARIDRRTLDDAAESARARQAAGTQELQRVEAVQRRDASLFAAEAISRQAFDASNAQLEGARAAEVAARRALTTARTMRTYAEVRAPYAGVVTSRLVEPGDLATPGKPLFFLQQTGPVRLISKLSQTSIAALAPGAAATFGVAGTPVSGRITRIFPSLDAARLGSVETVLPAAPSGLPPGAVVAATYSAKSGTGLVVPAAALLEGLTETLVVRVESGRAAPAPVVVVARTNRAAVVRGPITAGDELVIGLPSELLSLTAGTAVRIVHDAILVEGEERP